jgi:hypothetical protein
MKLSAIRNLKWADLFIYSMVDPRALYRQIRENASAAEKIGFLIPAIVALTEILAASMLGGKSSFFYYKISYGWILHFLVLSFFVILVSALIDMACQFMGLKGNIRELITLINFSLFPKVFLLPVVCMFSVIHFAPAFFYFLASFCLYIWSALIAVQGISEMHGSGMGKSLLFYLFPTILMGFVGFFSTILVLIGLFHLITG